MKCYNELSINQSEGLVDDNNKYMNLKNLGFKSFFSDDKKNKSTLFSFSFRNIYMLICIISVMYVSFMVIYN